VRSTRHSRCRTHGGPCAREIGPAAMDDRRAAHNALVLCLAVQQPDPFGFLAGPPPPQHAPPAAAPWQPGGAPRGHVGLEVTKRPPFQVVAVDGLTDTEGRVQGQPGYANKHVEPGDVLLRIGGETLRDVEQLQRIMPGPPQSILELVLSRTGVKGDEYAVRIQRSSRQDAGDVGAPRRPSSSDKDKQTGRWHDVALVSLPCAQVGLEVDRRWCVERVVAGSPADIKGGVRVGDVVRQINGRPCPDQGSASVSPFSGDAGTKVSIELESPSAARYVVHLVREHACQLGSDSQCGLPGGTSISLAYLAGRNGAAETLCLAVKVATSGDEVMMEGKGQGPGGSQCSPSAGARRLFACVLCVRF